MLQYDLNVVETIYLTPECCALLGLEYTLEKRNAIDIHISIFKDIVLQLDSDQQKKCKCVMDCVKSKGLRSVILEYKEYDPGWFIIHE